MSDLFEECRNWTPKESKLRIAYSMLLRIPMSDPWRVANQDIYARFVDAIATEAGQDRETVQTEMEALFNEVG